MLHLSIGIPSRDWYLQHFESATVIPAMIVGYFSVRLLPAAIRQYIGASRAGRAAHLAWAAPTGILVYQMLVYHALPPSVLYGSSVSAIKYFFDIQKIVPLSYPFASDPVRVWAQMSITGPFYAGMAYSLGALASSHQILKKIFSFERKNSEQES